MSKLLPEIVVVTCNWDGWSCVEAAVNSGLKYPPSVKVVKVNCLSRIHAGLILQALDFGADGLMLLGCEPGRCHFGTNSDCVTKEYEKAQNILELLGVDKNKLTLARLPAFAGHKFIARVVKFIEEIKLLSISDDAKGLVVQSTERR